jgi:hypothetical protein
VFGRLIIFMVIMGVLFVATTTLDAIWSPLAWLVPGTALVVLIILVAAALTARWPRRARPPRSD